ncbi:hypothetical protein PG995_005305 [Apiospora arundinis]
MQFSFNALFAALSMATLAAAQNGLCIERAEFGTCSGQYPQACEAISGTGVRFFSCCLASVQC